MAILAAAAGSFLFRRDSRLLSVTAASLGCGLATGTLWAMFQPAHPSAPPGVRAVIAGKVQSVKSVRGRTEIMLAVRRDGRDGHPCHYEAMVFVEGSSHVEAGQWLEASGTFVVADRAPSALDVLSPLQRFEGRVRALDVPPDVGERITSWMDSSMERMSDARGGELIHLALSMVFGDTQGDLPSSVSSDFLAAGVTHLLVASGSNVGFALDMAAIPWGALLGRAWKRGRRAAYGVYALCVVWGFALLCGLQLAVLRAACGASYAIAASMCGRRVHGYTVLWASAGMAGVLDPGDLLTPSMLLSFYAAFAVCEAEALWRRMHPKRMDEGRESSSRSWLVRAGMPLVRGLVTTAVVDAYMVPVLWWMFRQWTPYAAISTAILEPSVEMLLPVLVLWSVSAAMARAWPVAFLIWCAHGMSDVGCGAMSAVLWFVHRVASWRGSLQSLAPLSLEGACAMVSGLVLIAHARVPSRRR